MNLFHVMVSVTYPTFCAWPTTGMFGKFCRLWWCFCFFISVCPEGHFRWVYCIYSVAQSEMEIICWVLEFSVIPVCNDHVKKNPDENMVWQMRMILTCQQCFSSMAVARCIKCTVQSEMGSIGWFDEFSGCITISAFFVFSAHFHTAGGKC